MVRDPKWAAHNEVDVRALVSLRYKLPTIRSKFLPMEAIRLKWGFKEVHIWILLPLLSFFYMERKTLSLNVVAPTHMEPPLENEKLLVRSQSAIARI